MRGALGGKKPDVYSRGLQGQAQCLLIRPRAFPLGRPWRRGERRPSLTHRSFVAEATPLTPESGEERGCAPPVGRALFCSAKCALFYRGVGDDGRTRTHEARRSAMRKSQQLSLVDSDTRFCVSSSSRQHWPTDGAGRPRPALWFCLRILFS